MKVAATCCLLLLAVACGYHDTPVATYNAVSPDEAAAGTAGTAGAAGMAGATGLTGDAGAANGPDCAPSYTIAVAGFSSRYRESATPQNWVDAELDCESDGGHLIVIHDQAENDWMTTLAATYTTDSKSTNLLAWLGMGDSMSEGDFRWVIEPGPSFANWRDGEPNTLFSDEDCVEIHASGTWNDDRCDPPLSYVCECDYSPLTHQWCDTNTEVTCGDCSTSCAAGLVCDKQECK